MKKYAAILAGIAIMIGALILASCQDAQPQTNPTSSPASLVRGGLIYDNWSKTIEGATAPKDNQPLWATQTTNTRTGNDTWRCKECHGWDYRGKDGAYGKGSHLTGFSGVYSASTTKTKAQLLDILKGQVDSRHNFTSQLGDSGLSDVVNFLKEGVVDLTKYVDSSKKAIGANASNGQTLYSANCAACHGADGKQLLFDGKNSLGFLANDNPWETLHKIRFGQPGTPAMPSGMAKGWSVQDAVDILGFAQSLPQ